MAAAPMVLLLPHPDDEFALFGWIDAALQQGRQVYCLWLTDGGFGGQSVVRRREESERVLSDMGLEPAGFHFLGEQHGIPDGDLHAHIVQAYQHVTTCIAPLGPNIELLVPAWEGGHQDHDAAHLIGAALARTLTQPVLQYTLYQGQGLVGPLFKVMRPLAANGPTLSVPVSARQRLSYVLRCLGYRSQWKSFVGLLPFYALSMLTRHPFQLQPLDLSRTAQRPHAGPLLYERRGGPAHEVLVAARHELASFTDRT